MNSSKLPSGSRKYTLVPRPRAPRRSTGPVSTSTPWRSRWATASAAGPGHTKQRSLLPGRTGRRATLPETATTLWSSRIGRAMPHPSGCLEELLADDLDDPAPVARAVELHEEDALPRAEAELPIAHRDRLAGGPEEHGHAVGVAVAELHVLGADVLGTPVPVVVRVVLLARHEPPQHAPEVLEEARLELVHPNATRGVRRVHAGDAVAHAALRNRLANILCDVPDLESPSRAQGALVLEDLHSLSTSVGVVAGGRVTIRDMRGLFLPSLPVDGNGSGPDDTLGPAGP